MPSLPYGQRNVEINKCENKLMWKERKKYVNKYINVKINKSGNKCINKK